MAKPLKAQNRPALITVVTANIGVFVVLALTNDLILSTFDTTLSSYKPLLAAPIAMILSGLLSEQFSPNAKARIVFWRWANPLPGSGAFTELGPADPRVDMKAVRTKLGKPLPKKAEDQNTEWFKLYGTVKEDASVLDAHKSFLFHRDYASIAVLFMLVLPPLAFWLITPWHTAAIYTGGLILQYLLVRNAASNAGHRFVTNALAAFTTAPGTPAVRA